MARAKITQVSELDGKKQIEVMYDIYQGQNIVMESQSVAGKPSQVVEKIQFALEDYENEVNKQADIKVGMVIKSTSEK